MFTGIVEDIGKIVSVIPKGDGKEWEISSKFSRELSVGESVCIDGVCHTVTDREADCFTVFSSKQTLEITSFSFRLSGDFVNLERSLRVGDRLSGHFVYGHVDGLAVLESLRLFDKSTILRFYLKDSRMLDYIVAKGSIALSGISLTVYDKLKNGFEAMIIEHTMNNTNLTYLKEGDVLNVELDMLGKYVKGG